MQCEAGRGGDDGYLSLTLLLECNSSDIESCGEFSTCMSSFLAERVYTLLADHSEATVHDYVVHAHHHPHALGRTHRKAVEGHIVGLLLRQCILQQYDKALEPSDRRRDIPEMQRDSGSGGDCC